jgi:hypothetical protein
MKIKSKVPNGEAASAEAAAQTLSIIRPPTATPEQSSPAASSPVAPDKPTHSSPNMAPVAQSDQKVVEGVNSCFDIWEGMELTIT